MADLIEVTELDTGKREFNIERLKPLAVLNQARNRFCNKAGTKRIRVEVSAFADLSHIDADRRAVSSILDNLLSNAIRYTPEEGEILLAAEEIKNFVQFTVRNIGLGIEADGLGDIFDRFNVFSERGSGLGLALARRLVEARDGQIAVESRFGHGTTFRFTLPMSTIIPYSIPRAENVSLIVYNTLGQEVAHLVDGFRPAGRYEVRWNSGDIASGGIFIQTYKWLELSV